MGMEDDAYVALVLQGNKLVFLQVGPFSRKICPHSCEMIEKMGGIFAQKGDLQC